MSGLVIYIFSFSILLAGTIGLFRFKKIDRTYYPFLYLLWIGCINEIISFFLVQKGFHTIVNSNIYILLEAIFIIWYFQQTRLFDAHPGLFIMIVVSLLAFWITENLVLHPLSHYSIYFRIYYSAVIVFMSILTINQLLLREYQAVGRNATFILCIGFITYFLIKVLVNSFWLYGLSSSRTFLLQVSRILAFVNLITNFIYALAVIWIPKKQVSILR